jgi:FAD binding domain
MRTRDDLRAVIDALRERHSLLAAYLEAADRLDWRAFNRPMAIGELASVTNGGVSGRNRSELAGGNASAAAASWFGEERACGSTLSHRQFARAERPPAVSSHAAASPRHWCGSFAPEIRNERRKVDAHIVLCFSSEDEISYDYRDEVQQRKIISEQFAGQGWKIPELLEKVANSTSFYFDKICQIKMPSWTKGRVALVGDAAYCASPAAGMGGSLAIIGATALADAFQTNNRDFQLAFKEYDEGFRPYIERVQADALRNLDALNPRHKGVWTE